MCVSESRIMALVLHGRVREERKTDGGASKLDCTIDRTMEYGCALILTASRDGGAVRP